MDDVLRFYSAQTRPGAGYLGGDTPDGITTINNVPVAGAVIDVFIRDTRQWIRQTVTNHFGEWRIGGLPVDITYDTVARYPGKADLIKGKIAPAPYDDVILIYNTNYIIYNDAQSMDIAEIVGVDGPFEVDSYDLPDGIEPEIDGNVLRITGLSTVAGSPYRASITVKNSVGALSQTYNFNLYVYAIEGYVPVGLTTSGTYPGTDDTVIAMMDDNITSVTGWGSDSDTAGQNIVLDLGEVLPINKIILGGGSIPIWGSVSFDLNNASVDCSEDNINWTTIIPVVTGIVDFPPESRDKTFDVDTINARYVRIIKSSEGWLGVATFKVQYEP